MKLDNTKQDWPQDIDVFSVEIIPDLSIAVEHAAAVDIDVLAAELEEGGGVLEDLTETVGLPVVRVVGKLDVALDGCERG